jgi:hypothetical protein
MPGLPASRRINHQEHREDQETRKNPQNPTPRTQRDPGGFILFSLYRIVKETACPAERGTPSSPVRWLRNFSDDVRGQLFFRAVVACLQSRRHRIADIRHLYDPFRGLGIIPFSLGIDGFFLTLPAAGLAWPSQGGPQSQQKPQMVLAIFLTEVRAAVDDPG